MLELKTNKEMLEFVENIINTLRDPLITLDQNLRVVTVNSSFYTFFKSTPENTIGQLIFELGNRQWDTPALRELLKTILQQQTSFDKYEVDQDFADIGRRVMLLNARQIDQAEGKERIILLTMEDITERADELVIAKKEKIKRADELDIAKEEKDKRADELDIAEEEKGKRADELVIAKKEKGKRADELVIAQEEKGKRADELAIAKKEKGKRADELVIAQEEKGKRANELVIAQEEKGKRADELVIAQEEKGKREDELVIANKELAFQNKEKDKRADELVIANKELAFQNKEKDKRADELSIANDEKDKWADKLSIANDEKDKRADELSIANDEKDKRADELSIANDEKDKRADELSIANDEKDKRADELSIANDEKDKRADELVLANKELAFQNKEKDKRADELRMVNEEKEHLLLKLKRAASVFSHAHEGIMITDATATITEVNDTFTQMTGYTSEEVLGENPRMLQSGRHSSEFYVEMWTTLLSQDHWSGEIWNRRKNGDVYPEMLTISAVKNAAGFVQHYVSLCSDITTMKVYQGQLEHVAHYDVLTDLPNRVLLADRLSHAMDQCQRRKQSLAVAFMDLDGFKEVNDNYGHNVGDELLIAVSQRMKAALREGDTLARIGGDEFIAVMVDLDNIEESTPILERLLQAASDPVTIGNDVMQVSASIGVTLYPQDGSDADQLIRHADQAMYGAKQAGKNRYRLFDTALANASKVQLESISDIRSALCSGEFMLFYQPKVNMRTGAVIGVEALIRWQHPVHGLVPPAEFLPVIEGQAISLELGEWVISGSLSQISQWQSMGVNLPISVNISGYQLQQDNFAIRIAALLAAHPDVNPNCLELEILETSALHDISKVSATMNACHKLGVHFALDDFGTGYSSLTHLRHLPVKFIKIDKSFVSDMLEDTDDCAIVEGVIGLAKAFRRDVIAEGVETIAHGLALLQLGCELAQGYGIARPMPGADIPQWVSHWKADNSWQAWRLIEVNQLVTTEINRM
jgi:diguanylate cyclase (GGDEF)-like protein/PAS domain S-box-containing protein